MLCKILRFIFTVARFLNLVAINIAQTLLKSNSKAIKEGGTIKDVIMFALKPTASAVLGATVDQVPYSLTQMRDNHNAALLAN